MIKLKNLIDGTMHDPFTGKLYEGLIRSVDLDTAVKSIKKAGFTIADYFDHTNEFIVEISLEYPDDNLVNHTTGYIYDHTISELLKLANNLGYFPSFVRYTKWTDKIESMPYSGPGLRNLVYNTAPKIMWIIFNKKFDDAVEKKDIPPTLFHLTYSDYIERIKKQGLKPVSKSKIKYHPERVYFCLDMSGVKQLVQNRKFGDVNCLITVGVPLLPEDIQFYYDPDFYGFSIYTYQNIPLSCIEKIEKLK